MQKNDTNKTKRTTQVPVRWINEDLELSRNLAEKMGITWSDFARNALSEKIERELNKK